MFYIFSRPNLLDTVRLHKLTNFTKSSSRCHHLYHYSHIYCQCHRSWTVTAIHVTGNSSNFVLHNFWRKWVPCCKASFTYCQQWCALHSTTRCQLMLHGCHPLAVKLPESTLEWPINDKTQRLQKLGHPTGDCNKIRILINFHFHPLSYVHKSCLKPAGILVSQSA